MNIDSYEYQYPPELFQLLVDVIPILCKSKADILAFFTSAGIDDTDILDLKKRVYTDRDSIKKYEIAQTVLTRISEKKGAGLGVRRAVLQRVSEWEDFSTCWEKDRQQAEFLVAKIQKFVGRKDSITRLFQAEEEQRRLRAEEERKKVEQAQQRKNELSAIRKDLYALFGESNPQKRGKALEGVLNRLFKVNDLLVREAFALTSPHGEGIVEQIDGVVNIDGLIYLVEMKWWNEPIGVVEITRLIGQLYTRAQAHGIFISNSGYTKAAVATSREALRDKVIVLCELREIVMLLDQEKSLKDFLKEKIHAAVIDKNPLRYPLMSN